MNIKITEASLLYHVIRKPKMYVGKEMPYVVNTIGTNTERVVPCNTEIDQFPLWIIKPLHNNMKFIYSSALQDIECNYNNKHSVLILHGIKYSNLKYINDHISLMFRMLDTEYDESPIIKYKAIAKINIRTHWDINVLADIITNNHEIAHKMAICEKTCTLGDKKLFSVAVEVNNAAAFAVFTNKNQKEQFCCTEPLITRVCRVAFTYCNAQVTAMISKLSNEELLNPLVNILEKLFEIYVNTMSNAYVDTNVYTRVSNINSLRQKLPELFVNNYTRECPMLPIMISSEEAEKIHTEQRVIFYPLNSDEKAGVLYCTKWKFCRVKTQSFA